MQWRGPLACLLQWMLDWNWNPLQLQGAGFLKCPTNYSAR